MGGRIIFSQSVQAHCCMQHENTKCTSELCENYMYRAVAVHSQDSMWLFATPNVVTSTM